MSPRGIACPEGELADEAGAVLAAEVPVLLGLGLVVDDVGVGDAVDGVGVGDAVDGVGVGACCVVRACRGVCFAGRIIIGRTAIDARIQIAAIPARLRMT
jgi:hypothetical protein